MTDGQVALRMLGSIELSGPDGRPAISVLAQPRRLALLVYLAAAAPRGFHRKDTVRAVFWPEVDGLRARQSLNRAIYFLRQALDPEVLVTRGDDEVGVSASHLRCDVIDLERALDGGELETALELYRGDLAPGFLVSGLPDFDHWLESERARLRERAVKAAVDLVERAETNGSVELAERWSYRAGVLSPYDERLVAHRITLLDRMGDRAGALRAFEELRHHLRQDLEVDPSPETMALVEAVRSRRDSRASPEASLSPLGPDASATPNPPPQVLTASPPPGPTPTGQSSRATQDRPRVPVLVGAVSLALVAMLSALLVRPRVLALTTTNAVAVTREPGIEYQPSLSPDGSLVAYTVVAERRTVIGVRSTGGGPDGWELRPAATVVEDQAFPSWTGDGERLRYRSTSNEGVLPSSFTRAGNPSSFGWKEVQRLGGPVRSVPLPRQAQWVAWARDGSRAAFSVADSLFTWSPTDSGPRLLAVRPGAWTLNSLAWSPDGRWIACVSGNPFWPGGWNTATSGILLVASKGGTTVAVTDAVHLSVSPAWQDAGHLLFVSDLEGQREVYVIAVGPSGPQGPPVKMPGGTDAHTISVSADGRRLAVARVTARQNVRSFSLAARSRCTRTTATPSQRGLRSWKPTTSHRTANGWPTTPISGATRTSTGCGSTAAPPIPLVVGPAMTFTPRWSPDGHEIAFYGGNGADIGGDRADIWVVPAAGGTPTRLTTTSEAGELPAWSPDGLSLVFRSPKADKLEAWVVSRDRVGGPWHPPRRLTDVRCEFQVWAHDGSGVICGSPSTTALTLVSASGAVLWRRDLGAVGLSQVGPAAISPDGTTLYLRGARGAQGGIWAWPISGGDARLVVSFEEPSPVVLSYPGTINVTRDRLYLTVSEFESDIWVMDLVRR